jgi:hypothetical protein
MEIISTLLKIDWFGVLGALVALLSATVALATLIPGEEPERTLQKIVDFISRFSRK